MTKKEALKKAGYVPVQGRPPIYNKPMEKLSLRIPSSWIIKIQEIPAEIQKYIREAVGRRLNEEKKLTEEK